MRVHAGSLQDWDEFHNQCSVNCLEASQLLARGTQWGQVG